jgi:plastocyanin
MKSTLILCMITFSSIISSAANKFTITVANFQFTPSNLNVSVGDTIEWVWQNGTHTTTSTSVPSGASNWDAPMSTTSRSFKYIISAAGIYNYWCTIHAPAMAGTINASSVLPVSLSNFSVTPGNNSALLKWTTASEFNTDWFIVKKSINASSYTDVARIKAAGNSCIVQHYSFTDENTGTAYKYIYYELQIINKDGSSNLSSIQKFINNNAVKRLITQISPNPVASMGHLMFQFNAESQGEMKVQLYDVNGKMILQADMQAVQGLNNGHLHLGTLPAGIYNAIFLMDGMKETYRIVVR